MEHLHEPEAATIVSHFERGTFEKRDTGGNTGPVHDYDITTGDGRTIALEVTRYLREDIAAQQSCEAKYDWRSCSLRKTWEIKVPTVVDVRRLHKELPAILKRLEVLLAVPDDEYTLLSVEHMHTDDLPIRGDIFDNAAPSDSGDMDFPNSPFDLQRLLTDLGLGHATLTCRDTPDDVPGQVKLSTLVDMGGFGSNSGVIRRAISPIANKKSRQLECSSTDEQHLYIWIMQDTPDLHVALVDDVIPLPKLELRESIDVLWLAIYNYPPMIWRYDNHGDMWNYMAKRSKSIDELEVKLNSLYDLAEQARRKQQSKSLEHLNQLTSLLFSRPV